MLYNDAHGIKKLASVYKTVDNMADLIKGKILGIDASVLLNKIVKSTVGNKAEQYYDGNFTFAKEDFKQRIHLLRAAMIVPKLVFDGLNQGVHANYTLFI